MKAGFRLFGFCATLAFHISSYETACAENSKNTSEQAFGAIPAGYEIFQIVPLDIATHGVNGQLQILQDKRVTAGYRKAWGMSNDPDMALQDADAGNPHDEDGVLLKSIKKKPLRNGRLRLVSSDGRIISDEEFEVPLAKIETEFLYSSRFPSFLVWADYGTGMGSYAGPEMSLEEVRQGKLMHVEALRDGGKGKVAISYADSLKHEGRIVALPGGGKEIERIDCQPNFDDQKIAGESGDFVVEFSTFRFDGKQWIYRSRKEIGYIENDGDGGSWPQDRSKFP